MNRFFTSYTSVPLNTRLAQENFDQYRLLRDGGHLDFIKKAAACTRFVAGRQWKEADLALLAEQERPAITINKIVSVLGTVSGEQIKNRVEVLFRPATGAPDGVAEALSKVWLQVAQNNQLPWKRSDVFWDGMVTGRGFYDVRLDFSDSLLGEARISQLNPKNVLIDPEAETYDPDEWNQVILTKWMTADDIEALYNEADAELLRYDGEAEDGCGADVWEERDTFGAAESGREPLSGDGLENDALRRRVRVIERQHRKLGKQKFFVDLAAGDTRPIPEDWSRERIAATLDKYQSKLAVMEERVKRIRWTVSAGPVVLHDEWSPFAHFTVVPYFPYFFHGNAVGIVENLIGPQEILNKASSQELHVINTSANSGWVVEQDSLTNMDMAELEARGATTGLVLEYRKGAQPPQKIQPNQVPTGLDRVTYKAEEAIKSISNVSDSMQGFDREDVAAKAIAYKQQRGAVNLVKFFDNLERTDWLLARNVLALIQNYYTEPRLLNITHDDFSREQEQVAVNQPDPATGEITNDLTMGEYDIVISSSPYRASLEDSQFEQAVALRQLGVAIEDSVLIENSRLLRRGEIVKGIEAAKQSPEMRMREQLSQRAAMADIAVKETKAQKTMADARMNIVRAQRLAKGVDEFAADSREEKKAEVARERMLLQAVRDKEELALKARQIENAQVEGGERRALEQQRLAAGERRGREEGRAREAKQAERARREEEARFAQFQQNLADEEG